MSVERLDFDQHCTVFGRKGRLYESIVYLPVPLTKKQAADFFKGAVSIEHAQGKMMQLGPALSTFGPEGPFHDAFDYIDKF